MRPIFVVLFVLTLLVAALFAPLPISRREQAVRAAAPRTYVIRNEEGDRDRFALRVRRMLAEERYDDLESLADSLESTDARWASGAPRIATFVQRSFGKVERPDDPEQWLERLESLRTWRDHRPRSKWALLALAEALISRAYTARGEGIALTVSDNQHRRMTSDLDEARSLLVQARRAQRATPLWYEALLKAEHGLGAEGDRRFRGLIREAVESYPHDHRIYGLIANRLLPRWYGADGELADFAEAFASALPDSVADEYYARMASDLVTMYGESIFDANGLSWPRTRRGLELWRRHWPHSSQPTSMLALLACTENEPAAARSAFLALGDTLDLVIWESRGRYDEFRVLAFRDSLPGS